MIRVLTHPETEKKCTLYLVDQTLTIQTGNRKTEKRYTSAMEAKRTFEKKEWAKLKEGYVFKELVPKQGEVRFHQYIDRAYTGCLSMVDLEGMIAVYKHLDFSSDLLEVFDWEGNHKESIELPKIYKKAEGVDCGRRSFRI